MQGYFASWANRMRKSISYKKTCPAFNSILKELKMYSFYQDVNYNQLSNNFKLIHLIGLYTSIVL